MNQNPPRCSRGGFLYETGATCVDRVIITGNVDQSSDENCPDRCLVSGAPSVVGGK